MEVDCGFVPTNGFGGPLRGYIYFFNDWQSKKSHSFSFLRFEKFPCQIQNPNPAARLSLEWRAVGICRGWVFKVGRLYIFHLDERLTRTKSRPFAFRAGLQWTQKRILGLLMFQTCRPTNMELFGKLLVSATFSRGKNQRIYFEIYLTMSF